MTRSNDISLSPRQDAVLQYLDGCQRASGNAIRRATGAGANTIVALEGRGLIRKSGSQFRLTESGREAARI